MIIHWVLCFFPLNNQTNPVVKPGQKKWSIWVSTGCPLNIAMVRNCMLSPSAMNLKLEGANRVSYTVMEYPRLSKYNFLGPLEMQDHWYHWSHELPLPVPFWLRRSCCFVKEMALELVFPRSECDRIQFSVRLQLYLSKSDRGQSLIICKTWRKVWSCCPWNHMQMGELQNVVMMYPSSYSSRFIERQIWVAASIWVSFTTGWGPQDT